MSMAKSRVKALPLQISRAMARDRDDTGAAGTALDEAEHEEDGNGRRQDTAYRRQGKDRHADHQGQAAPPYHH
jgi:hypothetical protein